MKQEVLQYLSFFFFGFFFSVRKFGFCNFRTVDYMSPFIGMLSYLLSLLGMLYFRAFIWNWGFNS